MKWFKILIIWQITKTMKLKLITFILNVFTMTMQAQTIYHMERKFINTSVGQIAVFHNGITSEKTPVIFLHGVYFDHNLWKNQNRYRCHLKKTMWEKRRGNSRSKCLPRPHPYVGEYTAETKSIAVYGVFKRKKLTDDIR